MAIRAITAPTSSSGCWPLATTRQRDVPLYLKTLDGNANVLRLQPLHQQVLALLGPPYEEFYQSAK